MGVPGSVNNLLGISAGGYQISRSLRFNAADSAYLSRTPATAGSRTTWTWSAWIKRTEISSSNRYAIFTCIPTSSPTDTNTLTIEFQFDAIAVGGASNNFRVSTQVFRDVSAWYHIVVATDTTNATANNRIRIYVNGSEITSYSTLFNPNQNDSLGFNQTIQHSISSINPYSSTRYFAGYLADCYLIDGQQLGPTSFGEFDATTGVWSPKAYTGNYGTCGFKLDFADNSAATATTLGKDSSPNGNNWTPNNLSVTAGAGNDSLVDSPTNYGTDTGAGGEVRGNYCTLNPIALGGGSISNGALTSSNSSTTPDVGTVAMTSGKWYWEVTLSTSVNPRIGVYDIGSAKPADFGGTANGWCIINGPSRVFNNGSTSSYGSFVGSSGSVVMLAYDADLGRIWYGENGTWLASGSPATNANPSQTGVTGKAIVAASSSGTGANVHDFNFGQRAFAYTAPSGFKALCTANLPEPTILKGSTAFDVALYTGNDSTKTISGLNFSPDFLWLKTRSVIQNHLLYDTVRGYTQFLNSNNTNTEGTGNGSTDLTGFTSDGFTLGGSVNGANYGGATYAAWCWDAGSSTVTNTAGSITSSVRANATAGFAVITGSTPASNVNFTFGHGLGVAPSFVIYKHTAVSGNWHVYHKSGGGNNYNLNSTAGPANSGTWSGLDPTSTLITIPSGIISALSSAFVCYAFSPVAGYSSMGLIQANGSTDGPFVYTGHRSRFVLIKGTTRASNWVVIDTARNTYNVIDYYLQPNSSAAQATASSTSGPYIDVLSNGFKIRSNGGDVNNSGSDQYIYVSFAESPFNYSRAR